MGAPLSVGLLTRMATARPVSQGCLVRRHKVRSPSALSSLSIVDKFETMDLTAAPDIGIGKEVKILSFQNQSMIKGLKPFSFPYYIFNLIPMIFVLIGIPFLLSSIVPALKSYNLYKNGIIFSLIIVFTISNKGL